MPRRNRRPRRRQHVPAEIKPKSKKRPRDWHHGPEQDARFAEAERRFLDAEGEAA